MDIDVLTELKDDMKGNRVIPDVDTVLRRAPDFTEITKLDPADYATVLCPSFRATSVMPEPASLIDKESFREFMDELIAYVENPTPTQASRVRALQRMYSISVVMTDYPEQFSARITISLQCGMWEINQWNEMVPYEVADTIQEAVDYL